MRGSLRVQPPLDTGLVQGDTEVSHEAQGSQGIVADDFQFQIIQSVGPAGAVGVPARAFLVLDELSGHLLQLFSDLDVLSYRREEQRSIGHLPVHLAPVGAALGTYPVEGAGCPARAEHVFQGLAHGVTMGFPRPCEGETAKRRDHHLAVLAAEARLPTPRVRLILDQELDGPASYPGTFPTLQWTRL